MPFTAYMYDGPYAPRGRSRLTKAPAQQGEEWDDGLPDTLSPEEATDKRYKGGNIPSKVFKTLQKSVGDDTPETPPPEQQNGSAAPARAAKAPSQETATDF